MVFLELFALFALVITVGGVAVAISDWLGLE